MKDQRTTTRRIEMTAAETTEAIRQWLAKKDIVPPPNVEIVFDQPDKDRTGYLGVILSPDANVRVSMFWDTSKGGA